MKIVIRNYLAASFLLEQEPSSWDAIILIDPGMSHTDFVAEHTRRHIYLRFDDIDTERHGKRAATLDDVRAAIEFAAVSEKLMVSCRAGQSRSSAIAFLIGCHRLGPQIACELLNPKRHAPNSLIINLGASLIDDPYLLSVFHAWQQKYRTFKLSDYMGEIEHEFDELERKGARNRIFNSRCISDSSSQK